MITLNKKAVCIIFSYLFFVITSLTATQKKPWTFLVYIAAANNLNQFAYSDLEEMKKIGSNEHVNVLVYLTVQKEGQEKITGRYYIKKGEAVKIHNDVPMDSGSRRTLLHAMEWAVTEYPSDHVAVVLWNHGSGPLNRNSSWMRGICYDDQTGNFLTDSDYKYVFETIVQGSRKGKKIDIVACDACLMANIEVAYALEQSANFFVASQETIPGDGYDYSRLLSKFKNGSLAPEVFARTMVEAYDKTYQREKDYTLSVVDLNKLPSLTRATNEVAALLTQFLRQDASGKLRNIIEKCTSLRYCLHFTEKTYIDFYGFYRALLKYLFSMPLSYAQKYQLGSALSRAQRACNECILDNVHSANLKTAHGLSIYFPDKYEGIERSYPFVYWSRTTNWLKFIQTYLNPK